MAKKVEGGAWGKFTQWLRSGYTGLDRELTEEYDRTAENFQPETGEEAQRRNEAELILQEEKNRAEQAAAEHPALQRRQSKGWLIAYRVLAVLVAAAIITILLRTVTRLPEFGNADNPVNNEVSQRYIEQGMEETGAVNIVAGMILDYRAFDTLGESNVLFVAACAVIILLRIWKGDPDGATGALMADADDRMYEPKNDVILQHVVRLLVPFILMYGMYVIMNGHLSPGGGFSGGAVMGAGLILYLTAYGFRKSERFFTFKTFRVVSVTALTFYAGSKAYSFFTGANHLDSIITPGTPGMLFSAGLIPYLNLAVGLVVCCTMYAFYTLFRKGDM